MNLATLLEKLSPLAADLATLSLEDAAGAKTCLQHQWPIDGAAMADIRAIVLEGFRAGWLTPKENAGIKFGRLAKDLCGFTVDAVWMSGPGPKHRHGNGEIDLCFSLRGTPTFDGNPEGWTLYPPGSVHTPTVSGGEMVILYFLPKGAIEFLAA